MKVLAVLSTLMGIFLFVKPINCDKILVIASAPSKSHFILFNSLIGGLSTTKHDVTVLTFSPFKLTHNNVKVLQTQLPTHLQDPALMKEHFFSALKDGPVAQMNPLATLFTVNCEDLLKNDVVKSVLEKGQQYDLVVVDAFGDCSTAVASKLGKHIVKVYGCVHWSWESTQVPTPPSYIPNFMKPLTQKMNFWQRFENAVAIFGQRLMNDYNVRPAQKQVLLRHFPDEPNLLEEAEKKVVLSVTNGDPVVTSPRPTMPNVINCGGMHCKTANPLPKDLEEFVAKSGENGFIFFSLGSTMQSEFLPPEFTRSFLTAFSRLKQNVIWKYEAELDNLPNNVKIVKWLPQQDLLGHPKIRLFITHSGLLSLQESIYHGVPVIGMPFFGDQPGNIARITELGLGETISFFNVTTESLHQTIIKVLSDKSYYENMKKYSAIFKDQPEKPIERAVFWIEYVLRHNGAHHLRSSGEDLNFFQYYLLDVVSFVLIVAAVGLCVITCVVRLVVRKIRGPKPVPKVEPRKKKL